MKFEHSRTRNFRRTVHRKDDMGIIMIGLYVRSQTRFYEAYKRSDGKHASFVCCEAIIEARLIATLLKEFFRSVILMLRGFIRKRFIASSYY